MALFHEVNRDKRQVTARVLGGFQSRAIYRDGAGCLVMDDDDRVRAPDGWTVRLGEGAIVPADESFTLHHLKNQQLTRHN